MIAFKFVPLDQWPGAPTRSRRAAPFKSEWSTTQAWLLRELKMLRAENIVVQADCDESEIRRDGMLKADARLRGPGIVLAFNSKYGPLKYPCDTFTRWTDNLHAIVLGMEALRKVDRYGVTKRGEQYTGWKALPTSATATMHAYEWGTVEEAMRFLSSTGDGDLLSIDPKDLDAVYTAAARKAHPDAGGSSELMARVNRARDYIRKAVAACA